MTREDALMAMNGATLIGVADKLGVKAACNKTRTALKEAKANVIARILEAEAALAAKEAETEKPETKEAETTPAELETTSVEPETRPAELEVTPAEPEKKPEKKAKAEKKAPAEKKAKTEKKEPAEKKVKAEKKVQEPAEEPAEIKAAVTALDTMYDKLNSAYFDDLLPKPVITVRRGTKLYDCCSVKVDDGEYEIAVSSNAIGKAIEDTAASLLHAMVHLYCMETGIVETCQKGRYHNAKFKKECEDRNLAVESDSANGYAFTSATESFIENLRKAGIMDIKLAAIPAKNKKNGTAERA